MIGWLMRRTGCRRLRSGLGTLQGCAKLLYSSGCPIMRGIQLVQGPCLYAETDAVLPGLDPVCAPKL